MKDDLIPLHEGNDFLRSIRDRTTFESFKKSPLDIRAASYSILVISEAARRIPQDWLEPYPDTPWHAIRTLATNYATNISGSAR